MLVANPRPFNILPLPTYLSTSLAINYLIRREWLCSPFVPRKIIPPHLSNIVGNIVMENITTCFPATYKYGY